MTDRYEIEKVANGFICRDLSAFGDKPRVFSTFDDLVEHLSFKLTSGLEAPDSTEAVGPNWSKAPDWAQWWAVDEDDYSYWFEYKPILDADGWVNAEYCDLSTAAFREANHPNWRESLTKRPEVDDTQDYDCSIHDSPDALRWAEFFTETAEKNGWTEVPDTDCMHGWFANAMMAMHDYVHREFVEGRKPSGSDPDADTGSEGVPDRPAATDQAIDKIIEGIVATAHELDASVYAQTLRIREGIEAMLAARDQGGE